MKHETGKLFGLPTLQLNDKLKLQDLRRNFGDLNLLQIVRHFGENRLPSAYSERKTQATRHKIE